MKPIDQTIVSNVDGDCTRAYLAPRCIQEWEIEQK
jgi:hypothetical protein